MRGAVIVDSAILITYRGKDAAGEARALCEAADYDIVHTIRQKFLKRPKYGISDGALELLKDHCSRLRPDVVIYDEILKPNQNYNLASALNKKILDREALILEIFESRASSSESKMQVRLAQLRYEMARAKEKVRLSSMGEQPGFMGIGKFGVDVYYNDIKHRMQNTRAKLVKAGKQRELHRRARKRVGFKTISLAGYTSAGKTTLFNMMAGQSKAQGSELFTTLSTTTRRINIGEPVLLSDTVGFISKLPAYMIDAFKSTLEELGYADAVILVVDISDGIPELEKKFSSCMRTLDDLDIKEEKIIYALNKSDLVEDEQLKKRLRVLNLPNRWIQISAKDGRNVNELRRLIKGTVGSKNDN